MYSGPLTRPQNADQAMAMVERARGILEQARTFDETKDAKDLAAAAKVFLKGRQAARAAAIAAGEIEIMATRRLGEALESREKPKGGRPKKGGEDSPPLSAPSLADIGVTPDERKEYLAFAKVPKGSLEQYIDRCRASEKVPSRHGARSFVDQGRKQAKRAKYVQERLQKATQPTATLPKTLRGPTIVDMPMETVTGTRLSNELGLASQQSEHLRNTVARTLESRGLHLRDGGFEKQDAKRVLKELPKLRAALDDLETAAKSIAAGESAYGGKLRAEHRELLARAGITPVVALARGYKSAKDGLEIPIWDAQDSPRWIQKRIDKPKHKGDRYRNGRGACPVVDVSPHGRHLVKSPGLRLYVAESPRKADSAVAKGLACVATQGTGLISTSADEWNAIGVKGRDVYLVFDADAAENHAVATAEGSLFRFLESLGANVRVIRIPDRYGKKAGLDDALAAGATEEDLLSWVVEDYKVRERRCQHCDKPIPVNAHPQRLYCNRRCREHAATERAIADGDWRIEYQKR